jgi:catalase
MSHFTSAPSHANRIGGIGRRSAPWMIGLSLLSSAGAALAQAAPATEAASVATAAEPTPEELLNALNSVFGRHPGARGSHAKGFCAKGEFTPNRSAQTLSSAPLYRESKIPATVRFSIGGGNPKVSDKARAVRGLAIRLDGKKERHELVMISEPIFFAATTRSFIEFFKARVPDPATGKPDPAKIKAYVAAFPDGGRQPALVASHAPTASYAATTYHANHAFAFKAGATTTYARLYATPTAGVSYLTAEEEASRPDLFLEAEARERLSQAPIEFTVYAQPATPRDSLVDPTVTWSTDGPAPVALGRLQVRSWEEPSVCDSGMFVPTVLPTGIEPSADPILLARAAPYAISLGRRLGGQ